LKEGGKEGGVRSMEKGGEGGRGGEGGVDGPGGEERRGATAAAVVAGVIDATDSDGGHPTHQRCQATVFLPFLPFSLQSFHKSLLNPYQARRGHLRIAVLDQREEGGKEEGHGGSSTSFDRCLQHILTSLADEFLVSMRQLFEEGRTESAEKGGEGRPEAGRVEELPEGEEGVPLHT